MMITCFGLELLGGPFEPGTSLEGAIVSFVIILDGHEAFFKAICLVVKLPRVEIEQVSSMFYSEEPHVSTPMIFPNALR